MKTLRGHSIAHRINTMRPIRTETNILLITSDTHIETVYDVPTKISLILGPFESETFKRVKLNLPGIDISTSP